MNQTQYNAIMVYIYCTFSFLEISFSMILLPQRNNDVNLRQKVKVIKEWPVGVV